jgi:hypothetical protein
MIFRRVKSGHKNWPASPRPAIKDRLDDSKEPKTLAQEPGHWILYTESPGSGSYGLGFRVNLNLGFFSLGLLKREEGVVFSCFNFSSCEASFVFLLF